LKAEKKGVPPKMMPPVRRPLPVERIESESKLKRYVGRDPELMMGYVMRKYGVNIRKYPYPRILAKYILSHPDSWKEGLEVIAEYRDYIKDEGIALRVMKEPHKYKNLFRELRRKGLKEVDPDTIKARPEKIVEIVREVKQIDRPEVLRRTYRAIRKIEEKPWEKEEKALIKKYLAEGLVDREVLYRPEIRKELEIARKLPKERRIERIKMILEKAKNLKRRPHIMKREIDSKYTEELWRKGRVAEEKMKERWEIEREKRMKEKELQWKNEWEKKKFEEENIGAEGTESQEVKEDINSTVSSNEPGIVVEVPTVDIGGMK